MKNDTRYVSAFLACLAILLCLVAPALMAQDAAQYVCPPCGCEHDEEVFHEAGSCPSCGMRLVERNSTMNVGILVFDGVQIIDYTAPYEIFGQVSRMRPFTVAATTEPITTSMGMKVVPSHSFTDAPPIHILVVPGGNIHSVAGNTDAIAWVKKTAQDSEHVLTVCNGAFILAATGLLDGQRATTFYGLIDELKRQAPRVEVVRGERFVDNGKIITTAGLSSGIEGSLHVVSKLRGEAAARALALHLEYEWRPESNFARAALADLRLPRLRLPDGVESSFVLTEGDRERWENRWELTMEMSEDELLENLAAQMTRQGERWQPVEGEAQTWSSRDSDGTRWLTRAEVKRIGDGRYLFTRWIRQAPVTPASAR